MDIRQKAFEMKRIAPQMASSGHGQRNRVLSLIKEKLLKEKEAVFSANEADMARAEEQGLSDAVKADLALIRKDGAEAAYKSIL